MVHRYQSGQCQKFRELLDISEAVSHRTYHLRGIVVLEEVGGHHLQEVGGVQPSLGLALLLLPIPLSEAGATQQIILRSILKRTEGWCRG